ncbi:hypothetical protein C8R45DRAFT_1193855 [Mycena sanguinolenta]|nr:hypothetical protein C8R45DRAFT_1193855 [Mycena sanguinolenta]
MRSRRRRKTCARSLVMSAFLFMNAFSSRTLSAGPLLVWNYGVIAVLAAVTERCAGLVLRAR